MLAKLESELDSLGPTKMAPVIQATLKLVHVILVDLKLPAQKGEDGKPDLDDPKPDFKDAWSARVNDCGVSVLTARDALDLREKGEKVYEELGGSRSEDERSDFDEDMGVVVGGEKKKVCIT